MGTILGLIIGLLVGAAIAAGVVFLISQVKIAEKDSVILRGKKRIEQLEQEHEQRLQETTRQLREDYEQQLASSTADAQAQYQFDRTEVTALKDDIAAARAEIDVLRAELETLNQYSLQSAMSADTVYERDRATEFDPVDSRQQTNDSEAKARQRSATTLKQTLAGSLQRPTKQTLSLLRQLYQDNDPTIRRLAVEAIAQLRSPQVMPLLRRAMQDRDSEVVAAASRAVDQLRRPSSRANSYRLPGNTKKKLPKNR
ncbi:MAG: HEAT repeat domain-containing protein [Cyanobacteria bacterium P01_D01_bin.128]